MASDTLGLKTLEHPDFVSYEPDVFDIVVIHGLYGSSHSSWTDVQWETELLSRYGTSRLSTYSYDVLDTNGGVFSRVSARDEARKLLESLVKLRSPDLKGNAIVFIAHDFGGTLLKEVTILSQNREYEDIYTSISWMVSFRPTRETIGQALTCRQVFLGCPHRGLSKVELQSACTEILMTHGRMSPAEIWNLTGPLAEWVLETNDAFAETRLSISSRIRNIISSCPDPRLRVCPVYMTTTDLAEQI
ncbi:hypothetical protein BJ875DRAFT_177027 [Amylocarpus encephaloides]|uniref:Uncharacterized protein n=1 Tax=Amylocarpus encephaloides TaxID=45428 RepID=A0A9P8C242_9HELO|nr:hypothetical protein BJ875DRAFT_177027 [Amylocarpus encephaloides]